MATQSQSEYQLKVIIPPVDTAGITKSSASLAALGQSAMNAASTASKAASVMKSEFAGVIEAVAPLPQKLSEVDNGFAVVEKGAVRIRAVTAQIAHAANELKKVVTLWDELGKLREINAKKDESEDAFLGNLTDVSKVRDAGELQRREAMIKREIAERDGPIEWLKESIGENTEMLMLRKALANIQDNRENILKTGAIERAKEEDEIRNGYIKRAVQVGDSVIEEMLTAMENWSKKTQTTLSGKRAALEDEISEVARIFGITQGDTDVMAESIEGRFAQLQDEIRSRDDRTRTGAEKELQRLTETGAIERFAELANARESLAKEELRRESQDTKAAMVFEVEALKEANKRKLISDEEYAEKRLAILDKNHAKEAEWDTEDNREGNQLRRDNERLSLLGEIAGSGGAKGINASHLTDSMTAMGAVTGGGSYAGINSQWQTSLVWSGEKSVRLLEEVRKILSDRLGMDVGVARAG